MFLDLSIFETIVPARYITFTFPNHLRVAVLDSPSAAAASSSTAAMWVPPDRESDWIFSTFSGQLQLLHSSSATAAQPLSRLILTGKVPSCPHPTSYNSSLHPSSPINLAPLLSALTPKSAYLDNGEIPEMPFFIYEDELIRSSVLEICDGPCVGKMLIENIELETNGVSEFRRRLRFKRMPNFIQTQMRIHPKNDEFKLEILDKSVEFMLDIDVLVQPYLNPMVAGISVISQFLEGRMWAGFRPKALCLGVGGGALLRFLSAQLNFEVTGVEEDEVVLKIAKLYFGLDSNDEYIHLFVGDGINYVKKLAKSSSEESRFHVIMVDLDSNDLSMGGVCAPFKEFLEKSVLVAVRDVLCEEGVVVINTIGSSEGLIRELYEVFEELYEIDVGNGENIVVIATKSIVGKNDLAAKGTAFLCKLKSVIPGSWMDCIRKLPK